MTAWSGVSTTSPFDVEFASVDNGKSEAAIDPSIKTLTANAQLVSVLGAGNATNQAFALPQLHDANGPTDETGAAKVNGDPVGQTWFAHLVADRPQTTAGATSSQFVKITKKAESGNSVWTAISIALKPSA
jgi:hypothetical protein